MIKSTKYRQYKQLRLLESYKPMGIIDHWFNSTSCGFDAQNLPGEKYNGT